MNKNSKNGKFYRNQVVKDFISTSGSFPGFSYGANSITGWRLGQEDRYVCLPSPDFLETWSFFAVYDGHGGAEVSEYLKRQLHLHIIEKRKEFGDIKIALTEGFKSCDDSLRSLKKDEFAKIKDSIIKEFPIPDPDKPSTSNSEPTIDDDFMSEIKNEVFKQVLKMQTDLAEVPFPSDTTENNGKSKRNLRGKTAAAACSNSSDEEKNSGATSPALNEKKSIPLVGTCCGSTATVVVFTDEIIYIGNVGDSRCIASVKGSVKVLSQDHRPLNKRERERILQSGHKILRARIDGGLNMSRAFGDFGLKSQMVKKSAQALIVEPTLAAIEINPDLDFIVIASDGVWNNMENDAVLKFILKNIDLPLPDICAQIFEQILAKSTSKSGQDNMSMIIIKNELRNQMTEKMETEEIESKETDNKKAEDRETDTKKTEIKETDSKEIEVKETYSKKTEGKETGKKAENNETDSKKTESKETDKKTESTETDSKKAENKKTENRETESTKMGTKKVKRLKK